MSQHEESNTIKKTKGFISTSGSPGLIPTAKSPSPLSDWALFGRHHNQTDHFSRRISATSFATFTYLCADSNAAPVNYIQVFGRHCRLISKLSWLVKMWSCIKAITISAALITLEPLLISPRLFAQYLKLEDEAAKTCTVKLQATPSGSTHATGMSYAKKLLSHLFISFTRSVLKPGAVLGCWQVTLWTSDQFITGSQKQPSTLTFTPKANLELPITQMFICLDSGRMPEHRENPLRHRENIQTQTHRKTPDPGTKVRPSCCEVTVVLVCICKIILIL